MKYITIFGGSQISVGEKAYQDAWELGSLLAKDGYAVVTGGYMGTMEAVSRGAAEAGGHVIGVTCAAIETWRPQRANAWVKEERRCGSLAERIETMISLADAAIVMPGGPGTLTELSLMWNQLIIDSITARPLILVGNDWRATMESFYQNFDRFIPHHQRQFLQFALDIETAAGMIKKLIG